MLLDSDDLDIQDLADRSGLTVRTIRFYQQEGLLPAPGTRGKSVRYGNAELNRLLLIKALQEQKRLTLTEVGDRIRTMDDEAVSRSLALLGTGRQSAAAYARSVRLGKIVRLSDDDPPTGPLLHLPTSPPAGTTWERHALTPNVELHLRQPLSHPENKLVSRLIELARNTYQDGDPV